MYNRSIVESSVSLKEALQRHGVPVTHHRRNQLRKCIEQNGWKLNSVTSPHRPLSTRGVWKKVTPAQLEEVIGSCKSWTQVMRCLGLSDRGSTVTTAHKYARKLKIDTSHFIGKSLKGSLPFTRLSTDEIFIKNSTAKSSVVRNRIMSEGLLNYECGRCGRPPMWENEPLTLQLDHINGDPADNRLSNLRFLCPNCHSQTPTWGRKKR